MTETVKPVWHGIPRGQINWHPSIVLERCVGCGLCATSCGRNVYSFDYEANQPVVDAPQMCMVGCTTCATICTQDAIEFSSQGYIRQIIKKNKIVTQSKNMLRADPRQIRCQEARLLRDKSMSIKIITVSDNGQTISQHHPRP